MNLGVFVNVDVYVSETNSVHEKICLQNIWNIFRLIIISYESTLLPNV